MARSGGGLVAVDARRRWQQTVRRFERSGLSVARFCEAESISAWSLYDWRRKLGASGPIRRTVAAGREDFVEVGTVLAPSGDMPEAGLPGIAAGVELRIDLGGGLVLQILRR